MKSLALVCFATFILSGCSSESAKSDDVEGSSEEKITVTTEDGEELYRMPIKEK